MRMAIRCWISLLIRRPDHPVASWREFRALLELANRYGYLRWPSKLRKCVIGKDVLDVGCGRGLHCVGFVYEWVRSYTWLDPVLDLGSGVLKDCSSCRGVFRSSEWTPERIMKALPLVRYRTASTLDLEPGESWDVIVMHNVTEHLMQISEDFELLHSLLRPGGRIAFDHPNYYSWSGHHMAPRVVAEIDPTDPEQQRYMDWNHVSFDASWPPTILHKQNRIRLGELRALTERFFEIEKWVLKRSDSNRGIDRLTPEIVSKYQGEFTEEELATQGVTCIARKRGKGGLTRMALR